ncbi:glutamine synthetase family protein [Jannaschia aquimarina]|uniref:PuuA_2 protein n=1 Tax=Jannaschia aquimarina TaxID=935700 RepID=A0A0D1EH68_9RHOB|nr:glutamine synthetase family protein [Jannaschia aquimarina]KIT15190.1 Gamma-glutamylputrescine synthetase PuuA [Jannaschia aquimarina]SNS85572.1 glutamate--putrescine ligase [Jannaschia aquimarina]
MTDDPSNPASILVGLCDINGVHRGKRIPAAQLDKLRADGVRMPVSICTVDIWGRDIEGSELVFDTGDADGICRPIGDRVHPSPWLGEGAGFLPVWMWEEDGSPHPTDSRQVLSAVLDRYRAAGLTPVVATELEFYLIDTPAPEARPVAPRVEHILSLAELERLSPFFDDVYAACADQGVAIDTAISEGGRGQYEINLRHRDDALRAADDAVLFKRIVKGFASAHGYDATFMAKPFGHSAGSGMHVHFSLLDRTGRNVFDDGTEAGSDTMRHAIGGLVGAMAESTLILAPHHNSYRRIRPNSHAPIGIGWGYENRTAAIRVPGGDTASRRIEHRVAGADANPYLVLAAILGAALDGIDRGATPPDPTEGNAYEADLPELPLTWAAAIDAFEAGETMARIFHPQFRGLFARAKRQELERFLETVTMFEYATYRESV